QAADRHRPEAVAGLAGQVHADQYVPVAGDDGDPVAHALEAIDLDSRERRDAESAQRCDRGVRQLRFLGRFGEQRTLTVEIVGRGSGRTPIPGHGLVRRVSLRGEVKDPENGLGVDRIRALALRMKAVRLDVLRRTAQVLLQRGGAYYVAGVGHQLDV